MTDTLNLTSLQKAVASFDRALTEFAKDSLREIYPHPNPLPEGEGADSAEPAINSLSLGERARVRAQNVPQLRFPEFSGEWVEKKLGDLLEIKSASRVLREQWTVTGVPFFRTSDVVSAYKGQKNDEVYISMELFNELSQKSGRTKKNDLLVTGGGSIGIPYLVKDDNPLYFKDADLLWFRITDELNGFYLYTFFLTDVFRNYLNSITHTGTISHYTIEQAKDTPINLPSLPEQTKIASFLPAVDTKIDQLTQKKTLLNTYKKGAMQQIFSQQIRFTTDEGGEYPEWEENKLGEVATFLKGNGISKDDVVENGKLECIRYGELYTHYKETIYSITSRTNIDETILTLSKKNDVIIPSSGETAIDLATASCVLKDGVALGGDLNVIRTQENGVFLSYYLNNAKRLEIAALAQGSSVIHLYSTHLKKLVICIPCLEEQTKIANFLSAIDRKIDLVSQQLDEAKAFKKGLLQQMFV